MTQQNTMPDEIFVIKGVTERFDGVWDDYQWSDQRGTKYLRADLHTDLLKHALMVLRRIDDVITPSEYYDDGGEHTIHMMKQTIIAINKVLGEK